MPDGRIKNFKSYQHFQKHTSLGFFLTQQNNLLIFQNCINHTVQNMSLP